MESFRAKREGEMTLNNNYCKCIFSFGEAIFSGLRGDSLGPGFLGLNSLKPEPSESSPGLKIVTQPVANATKTFSLAPKTLRDKQKTKGEKKILGSCFCFASK